MTFDLGGHTEVTHAKYGPSTVEAEFGRYAFASRALGTRGLLPSIRFGMQFLDLFYFYSPRPLEVAAMFSICNCEPLRGKHLNWRRH